MLWVTLTLVLAGIAAVAFYLTLSSDELDWRPVFVVLAGNVLTVTAAFAISFVWPSRQVMLTGTTAVFHEDGRVLVFLLGSLALFFSLIEVLGLWCVASTIKHLQTSRRSAS